MQTLPPRPRKKDLQRPEIIRRTSRNRYARRQDQVEQEIREVFAVV